MKIRSFCLSFLLVAMWSYHTNASCIGKPLYEYEDDDIRNIGLLCQAAYPDETEVQERLREAGWSLYSMTAEIEVNAFQAHGDYLLSSHMSKQVLDTPYQYGIAASFGPLSVFAFKGTDDTITQDADVQCGQMNTSSIFPEFPESIVARGMYSYYDSTDFSSLIQKIFSQDIDSDQSFIFAGHSLGGAVSNFAALDVLHQQKTGNIFLPDSFCSLVTFGAPPVLGQGLCYALNEGFSGVSHARYIINNDPIPNNVPGYRSFTHAGTEFTLTDPTGYWF